ncbi:hypothetical protein VFMJ11_A0707 [Aliivibrio fischeri MJ11]|uniref:Uncharacterized protein n=1 Tax=Aliivibrio fischeri (strain MJ11) TaxID=388396 RepID=B5EU88_ALIFM|nr:hypothetical protein VFMJ11_A0707 [Aliivibrio fischeri MJ11]
MVSVFKAVNQLSRRSNKRVIAALYARLFLDTRKNRVIIENEINRGFKMARLQKNNKNGYTISNITVNERKIFLCHFAALMNIADGKFNQDNIIFQDVSLNKLNKIFMTTQVPFGIYCDIEGFVNNYC